LDTITNAIGCDSIVTLHLTINTPALSHETANMCSGESYVWHGQTYTAAGMYLDTLTAANGCDSICTLKLQVYPNSQTELEVTECGAYTWNGNTYYESGDYQYTTQNMFGCDSIVTLHLTILKAAYERIDHGTITPDQAAGYPFDAPGQYTWNDTVRYSLGCDSVITTHILVIEPYKYAWKVESNDPAMGTILTASADTFYYYGASVTAEAIPNSGYQFVKWNDGKTDNPYRMTMVEDTYLRAIFAAANTTPEETAVTPTSTTATFTWPLIIGGYTYTLTIYLNSEMTIPFCDILFDQFGRFISRIFSAAPARHQMAQNDSFTYTITDLTPKTDYYFQMKASSQDDLLLNTDIGSFKTEDTTTGIDEMVNDQIVNVKVLRDGHLYILHGNKIFTATGQEVR